MAYNITQMILSSVPYVISDQYFWVAMGLTVSMAMFVGAILYNGNLDQIRKGIVSMGSYAIVLLYTNISRVSSHVDSAEYPHMPFAGAATIGVVTIFYFIGMYLGVLMLNLTNRRGK